MQFAGAADQVPSFTATAESVVAPPSTSDLAIPTTTANNKSGDPDSGSSSSSDSDSDSDSEDESEVENKSLPPDLSESPVKKEAKAQDITRKLNNKHHTPFCVSEAEATPAAAVATREAVQASVEALGVSSEVLVDSAPEICAAVEYSPASKSSADATSTSVLDVQTPAKFVTEPTTSKNAPADEPIETTQPALNVASAKDEATSNEATAENATEICAPVDSAEELVDYVPVLTEAVDEKLQTESAVEPPQGTYYTTLPPNLSLRIR